LERHYLPGLRRNAVKAVADGGIPKLLVGNCLGIGGVIHKGGSDRFKYLLVHRHYSMGSL
jgi:hypothetical protein